MIVEPNSCSGKLLINLFGLMLQVFVKNVFKSNKKIRNKLLWVYSYTTTANCMVFVTTIEDWNCKHDLLTIASARNSHHLHIRIHKGSSNPGSKIPNAENRNKNKVVCTAINLKCRLQ